MDDDGEIELVTGALHAYPPFGEFSRITLWERIEKTEESEYD